MDLYLLLVNGKTIEQKLDSKVCVIGRSSKCDVVVPHEGMSRLHCQIEVENGEVFVTDLGSTNGVSIDGQKIEPHKRTLYKTYLTLSFGAVQNLQLELDGKEIGEDESQTDKTIQHRANLTRTITKSMQHRTRPEIENTVQRSEKKIPTKNSDKTKMWIMNIMVILLFGGVLYWYLQQEPVQDPESDYGPEMSSESEYSNETPESY